MELFRRYLGLGRQTLLERFGTCKKEDDVLSEADSAPQVGCADGPQRGPPRRCRPGLAILRSSLSGFSNFAFAFEIVRT